MHPNFGLPVVPGILNNPFHPKNPVSFNPNVCPPGLMFQRNPLPQFSPSNPVNSQHVFPGNASFQNPMPSPFIPDLQIIKSVPPPSFKAPLPPTLPGNLVPEMPSPVWNSTQMINNNHFNDQAAQFKARPPSAPPFPPSMFPSNYNNIDMAYSNLSGFNVQQNSFQRNQGAPFTNVSSNSSVQPASNSFNYVTSGVVGNPKIGNTAFSNGRNSSNFNKDNSSADCFRGNSIQTYSSHPHWISGAGHYSGTPYNGNEKSGPKAPFKVESNGKTPNANNFHHNRGRKRRYGSGGSYTNNKELNSYSMNQGKANNAFGANTLKSERNSDVAKPYSCDTCDRAFATESEMMHHVSEHVKCNSGDCQFEAHPKIVALHKRMQHDTGYADAISKLKNADEIEKWRAERRRRFPTAENIEKRKAEQADKEARGEVIENKEFGKFKGRNCQQSGSQSNDRKNGKKRRRGAQKMRNALSITQYPHSIAKHTASISDTDSDSDDDSHIKLPEFLGMAAFDVSEKETLETHTDEFSSNSQELSDNMTRKRTVSPMPMGNSDVESENPIEKNTSSAEESMERDDQPQKKKRKVFNAETYEDFDELPITKGKDNMTQKRTSNPLPDSDVESVDPMEKNTSCAEQSMERDDQPQVKKRKIFNAETYEDIDDHPIEIPISKRKDDIQQRVFNMVSDLDVDDGPPLEIPITKSVSSTNEGVEKDSADDFPVELCAEKSPSENQSYRKETKNGYSNSRAKAWRETNGNREYPELPHKSSLLEKLLADDIRHERNVIMQCVRHVVKKNFFDINVNN